MRLATAGQAREADRRAEMLGMPTRILMENAGLRVAERVRQLTEPGDGVLVLCGRGNNGGDGFVAARHLQDAGRRVRVWLAAPEEAYSGDAAANLELLHRWGTPLEAAPQDPQKLDEGLGPCRVAVDALLGTGARGPLREPYPLWVAALNRFRGTVVSVDLPSGVDADTGQVYGEAVRAGWTVTFGYGKPGLFLLPGASFAGRVEVAAIGLPPDALPDDPPGGTVHLLEARDVAGLLPDRPAASHKGTYGHLLVVAGSRGMIGAAVLAARGALRAGAGLVTVATPASLQAQVAGALPEALTHGLPDSARGTLGVEAVDGVVELMAGRDVLAIGPGLGTSPETEAFLLELMAHPSLRSRPWVLDADGLNLAARAPERLSDLGRVQASPVLVITPHPGEMARLLGCTTADIQADRPGRVREAAARFGAVAVLKGARSLVADPRGRWAINPTGNPGMATGGMGDVLTGAVGALLAQGLGPWEAARAAVYLHGLAGDLVAATHGPSGLLAGEVADHLPAARRQVLREAGRVG